MPVNLSIKNAPDDVVEKIRQRAKTNHRSLQGELMAILEEATRDTSVFSVADVMQDLRKLDFTSPSESARMLREDRDKRPIQTNGRRINGVLISEEDFQAMQETLHLLSIPEMKTSLLKAKKAPLKSYSKKRPW